MNRWFGPRTESAAAATHPSLSLAQGRQLIQQFSHAHSKGCYAEVWYSDQTYGHTYEYLCGNLRLHAGQTVRVPVRNDVTTARVVRISRYRTYFGGPLKTVRAVIS